MLQHETVSEATPLPVIPRPAAPPTPQELAQAVVTVQKRQNDSAGVDTGSEVTAQTIAQCGLDITPARLLAEVQEQRTRMAQEAAMTKRKLRDPVFWLLVAGTAAATGAALFLLFTAYRFANGMRIRGEQLANYQAQDAIRYSQTPTQLLQSWSYPLAHSNGGGSSSSLDSESGTTPDAYENVWKFYAQKASGSAPAPVGESRLTINGALISNMNISGSFVQSGQSGGYEIISNNASADRMATFIQHVPQGTRTAIITYDAALKQTRINLFATTPYRFTQTR